MLKICVILVIFMMILGEKTSGAQSLDTIDFKMVQQDAKKIGEELLAFGEVVTKRQQIYESFSSTKVIIKNGTKIVDEIVKDVKALLDSRVLALRKIIKVAEYLPPVYENNTSINFKNYTFINTRSRDESKERLRQIAEEKQAALEERAKWANYTKKRVTPDPPVCIKSEASEDDSDDDDEENHGCYSRFYENINPKSKEASVFFPVNVYDRDKNATLITHRSKGLDKAFNHNYRNDPSIGWQYFCNSSGLFRHFPATTWDFQPINTFDCRYRPWFTGAATSAKDIVILIETAGSMKQGLRIEIAKDVVRNLLDTLTSNDYVTVIAFNDKINFTISCTDGLIQATPSNVLALKESLLREDLFEPNGISNLTNVLPKAFQILSNHTVDRSDCNKAIMLITDGMEYNKKVQDIFATYNWNRGNTVRIFSYLIGKEIPLNDYDQIRRMACENRGYYTQLDTIVETREEALRYIPVMARPLSYEDENKNNWIWSGLYADIIEPLRTTNHDWNCRQNEVQRDRVVNYLKEFERYVCITEKKPEVISKKEIRKYVFMTTVSMPAFERLNSMSKSLMGVAAIDVPLYEFERLFQSYRLGVGGYAFVIDQNGNILTHPDFRPTFQGGILKPAYNSIDMAEVELMDDGYPLRDFSSYLVEFRASIIEKPSGSKFMIALQPYDDMRRAIQLKRNYFWRKISGTPFTLIVTFPDHFSNGINIPDDIDSMKGKNYLKYFKDNFRIHPNWIYCRSIRKSFEELKLGYIDPDNCEMTPEEELVYYLEKFETSGAKWNKENPNKLDSNDTRCDKKLMNLLLYDARVTENFPSNFNASKKNDKVKLNLDVKTSFISTHSGLLRFKIFDKSINAEKFADKRKKSIDEVWYKHAVEFNRLKPEAYVYSVAFNAFDLPQKDRRITVTRTIFLNQNKEQEKVPVAVVGYQILQKSFADYIEKYCPRDRIEQCFILDDNAYVIYDPDGGISIGKFFGRVEPKLMSILIEDNIYTPISVYDYQGVCYKDREIEYAALMVMANSALKHLIWNPIKILFAFIINFISNVYSLPSYMANLMYPDNEYYYRPEEDEEYKCPNLQDDKYLKCLSKIEEGEDEDGKRRELCYANNLDRCFLELGTKYILKRHVNKTLPKKCDKQNKVYQLNSEDSNFEKKIYHDCNRPFVVHKIPNSNLILLKTNRDCSKINAVHIDFEEVPKEHLDYGENTTLFCFKRSKPQLSRSRPKSCFSSHIKEPKFDPLEKYNPGQCGRGNQLKIHKLMITFTTILLLYFTTINDFFKF